jgi:hypothetical protein
VGAAWFRIRKPIPQVRILAVFAKRLSGYLIFKEATTDVLDRRMTMFLPNWSSL